MKRVDLCGCIWKIEEDLWVCVKTCKKHSGSKPKKQFRPKAECVRSGGKFD